MRKTKLQIIDSTLFLYGTFVTFFLIITSFFNLDSPGSSTILILFIPVAIYFVSKIFASSKRLAHSVLNLEHSKHPYFGKFSLLTFLNQSEPTFLLNLVLLCFALALILFRISLQNIK